MSSEPQWQQLQQQLADYLPLLARAAESVVDQEVSNYPILVYYHGEEVAALGLPVVSHTQADPSWSVNLTTLEELVTRKVVAVEKVDDFRQLYRARMSDHLCFLVWAQGNARFAFVPRPATVSPPESESS